MPPLWREYIQDMMDGYDEICAYSGMRIPPTEIATIDHFLPRSTHPQLAYSWSNLRLCKALINSAKSDQVGIADPVSIRDGIFSMNYVYELLPGQLASSSERDLVYSTIHKLKLNSGRWIRHRGLWVTLMLNRQITPELLEYFAPFLYSEVRKLYPILGLPARGLNAKCPSTMAATLSAPSSVTT
jgi:hypothetical protein